MFASWYIILLFIIAGAGIQILGEIFEKVHKKIGISIEIILALVSIGFVFYKYSFIDGFIYIALISSGYFLTISLSSGHEKRRELEKELRQLKVESIPLKCNLNRLVIDL